MHRRHGSANSDTTPEEDEAAAAEGGAAGSGGGLDSWNPNQCYIHVDLAHVGEYDAALLGQLLNRPGDALPVMEMAAADALRTLLYAVQRTNASASNAGNGMNEGETEEGDEGAETTAASNNNNLTPQQLFGGNSIQILLRGNLTPTPLRSIQSHHMNALLKCPGIITSCARVRPRAMALRIRCAKCLDTRTVFGNSTVSGTNSASNSTTGLGSAGAFSGFSLPPKCLGPNPQECGPSPYAVLPDDCLFVDQQTLKLQEAPEMVPTGEMPRSVLVAVERGLVDKAPPGTRVTVLAIASLYTNGGGDGGGGGAGSKRGNDGGGVKTTYLRVVGMERESSTADSARFSPAEEEAFRQLSRRPDVYDILHRSVAPSIQGSYTVDIKKAILCLLFGGSRKRLPDGMRLRGDINVLLLGDPSTAKSQFLKFATNVAPVGVYTSGKGSSAAGLTASVVRDARGEFYLEGGAMVLADGGVVAIDEFDK